jgi:NAD(P)-dependent dehydrogenase (short-subunit alcohol dehydrogenase family)
MTGKVTVITGAGSGIGRAVAVVLAERGHRLVLAGRRRDALEATAGMFSTESLVSPCDVTREDEVDAMFASAVRTFGRIDVLFNNAGAFGGGLIDEISAEDWRRIVDVNLTGSFLCAKAAFRQMRAQSPQGGRIVNNGSISAQVPRYGSAPYTATKHAIAGLTKSIALDGRAFGIACGQIDIGNAQTDLSAGFGDVGMLQADGERRPEPVFDVRHAADAVAQMVEFPLDTNILSMTVMATAMPFVGRG